MVLVHDAARPLRRRRRRRAAPRAARRGLRRRRAGSSRRRHAQAGSGRGRRRDRRPRGLVAAQTPQAFVRSDASPRVRHGPHEAPPTALLSWSGAGGRVAVVDGDPRLLKVTTRADLDARRVVALTAVVFDVGETLVDEESWWRRLADREGLQPHVVWAALGVTIARGEEHDRSLGSPRDRRAAAVVARDSVLARGSLSGRARLSRARTRAGTARRHRRKSERRRSRRGRATRRSPPTSSPRRRASAYASPTPPSSRRSSS